MMGAFETHSFMASITVHCPRCNSDHVLGGPGLDEHLPSTMQG
ncbi:MAG: IS1 family transposase [Shewanella sp.]